MKTKVWTRKELTGMSRLKFKTLKALLGTCSFEELGLGKITNFTFYVERPSGDWILKYEAND